LNSARRGTCASHSSEFPLPDIPDHINKPPERAFHAEIVGFEAAIDVIERILVPPMTAAKARIFSSPTADD